MKGYAIDEVANERRSGCNLKSAKSAKVAAAAVRDVLFAMFPPVPMLDCNRNCGCCIRRTFEVCRYIAREFGWHKIVALTLSDCSFHLRVRE